MNDRTIKVVTEADGTVRVRVDAPGERAVSAPVTDAALLIQEIADAAGLDVITNPKEANTA
jgi:hypothetical protein